MVTPGERRDTRKETPAGDGLTCWYYKEAGKRAGTRGKVTPPRTLRAAETAAPS
ncbi:hypothetical protein GA0115252_166421 [Streptomyces sp. DfronAA-171]|nr:hypothetical protein GA0115252_166421 [Streptomyces sp. DfronAA-171]